MAQNKQITTITASGKTIRQTPEKLVAWCSNTRSRLLQTQTPFEDIVFSKLSPKKKKHAVRQQRLELDSHIYFADIYIARWKIIIEVDGGYHNTVEKKESDRMRDALCSKYCIRVFRITNSQVLNEETLGEFMRVVNESELPTKHILPLKERDMKYLANPNFAANGIFKKEPRIHVINNGRCKTNSIKYLRKKKHLI